MLIKTSISWDRNVIKKEAEKILKYYKGLTIEIQRMCSVKIKRYTSNNRGNWNHLRIVKKIP
jgi:hypothetical protein